MKHVILAIIMAILAQAWCVWKWEC